MKSTSVGQREVTATSTLGEDQTPKLPENMVEEPLVVTADQFSAVQLGTPLAHLVKGTPPQYEDCGPGGEDCACDCGGGNCACECHECG